MSGKQGHGRFSWHTCDVNSAMPHGWQQSILDLVADEAKTALITASSVTSREVSAGIELPTHIVGSVTVTQRLPWLDELYRGLFRGLVRQPQFVI